MANKVYITLEVDDKGSATMKKFGGNADQAFDKLKKNAKAGATQAGKMERAWSGAIKNIQHHWKAYSAIAGIAMAAVAAAIVAVSKKAIAAASDLQEVQGKFDVVFAKHSKQAEGMAKILVKSYAMSEREAKQYMSSIQDLLVPMGMAANKALLMSNEVVKLSADLASFNNLPTAQVMLDIQSALVGNFETMKKYGVILNEHVVKEKAFEMGLYSGKGMVDANTKALVAYKLMIASSTAAIGDQQRTMSSYANQMKQLRANVENIAAAIGDELLPEVTAWVNQLNTMIETNPQIIKQMGDFAKNVLGLATAMGKVIALGAEFTNVWVKTFQAMGLASAGMITWSTALTDGVNAVDQFNKGLSIEEFRLLELEKIMARTKDWPGVYTQKAYQEAKKEAEMLREIIASRKMLASGRLEQALADPSKYYGALPTEAAPSTSPIIDLKEKEISSMDAMVAAYHERQKAAELVAMEGRAQRMADTLMIEQEYDKKALAADKNEAKAYETAMNTVKEHASGYHLFRTEQLDVLAAKFREASIAEVDIERWKNEELKQLTIEKNQYILDTTTSLTEGLSAVWENYSLTTASTIQQISELSISTAETFAAGVGNAFAQAIIYGESLAKSFKDLMKQIASQIISSLIQIGIQKLIQWIAAKILLLAQATSRMATLAAETYAGAYAATACIPIVGPALAPGVAAASLATMLTGATGAGVAGATVGATIATYDQGGISEAEGIYRTGPIREAHIPLPSSGKIPVQIGEDRQQLVSRTVNIHIYGNVVDHDEFARELVPSIQKAIDDGVH